MPRRPPDIGFLATATPATSLFAAGRSDQVPARHVAITLLDDNPYQPRESMDPEQLAELATVIRLHGFQGVLIARPHPQQPGRYQLAFGHRRREAAKAAGLDAVPVHIQDLDDRAMIELAVTENIQREDLNPVAEGRTYLLMEQQLGYTHEEIATRVGRKRGYIENRLRLTRAPEDVQALVESKPDSLRAASDLIQIMDPQTRGDLIAGLQAGELTTNDVATVRQAETGRRRLPAAAHGGPSAARSPHVGGAESDERALVRARNARLETALQSLTAYQRQVADCDEISLQEFANLGRLRQLIETLHDNHSTSVER